MHRRTVEKSGSIDRRSGTDVAAAVALALALAEPAVSPVPAVLLHAATRVTAVTPPTNMVINR